MTHQDIFMEFKHSYNNTVVCDVIIEGIRYRIDPHEVVRVLKSLIINQGYHTAHEYRQRYKRIIINQ